MEIEPDDWIAITGCGVVRSAAPADERRRAVRVPLGKTAAVYRLSGGTIGGAVVSRVRARIREVSVTGVGLVLTSAPQLTPGEVLVVGLPRRRSTPLWVFVAAVRESSQSMGVRAVGARFERMVLPGELRVARPAPKPGHRPAPSPAEMSTAIAAASEGDRNPATAATPGGMVITKATSAQVAWLDSLAENHMEVYRAIYERMPAAGIPTTDLIFQQVYGDWENLRAMRQLTARAVPAQAAEAAA